MNFAKFCVFAFCALAACAEVPSALAIKDARIVTVSGPSIEKGTVVVRRGLIEAVGANVTIPPDAWVLEGAGLTVYPGLIDGLSTWGLADEPPTGPGPRPTAAPNPQPPAGGPEDRPSTTSWLKAQDMIRPTDRRIEAARNAGFTSAATFPTRGIFAGQGALINLAGSKSGQLVVAASIGQYVAFTPAAAGYPLSLMGVIAYVRQVYLDADHYQKAKTMYTTRPSMPRPEYDRALEGVLESPRVLLPANRTVDIDRLLAFTSELKLKPVLYGVHRGFTRAEVLARSGVPVLVSLKWPEKARQGDPEAMDSLRAMQLREEAPSTPKALAAAKAKFGFYSGGIERPADILAAVKKAIDAGLTHDDAVRAMTLSVAEIYGIADRLGSIDKGKIANLTVTRGDLFRDGTKVQYVLIDGVKYEPSPEIPAQQPASTPTEGGQN